MKKVIITFVAVICLAVVLFGVLPVRSQFEYSACPANLCAFTGHRLGYDKDNVTLKFYYGTIFGEDLAYEKLNGRDIEYAELYFEDAEKNLHFIKRSEEHYTSDEYRCNYKFKPAPFYNPYRQFELGFYDDPGILQISYTHSEKIQIPAELFTEECGKIKFKVYGKFSTDEDVSFLSSVNIYYKVRNGRVYVSDKAFRQ